MGGSSSSSKKEDLAQRKIGIMPSAQQQQLDREREGDTVPTQLPPLQLQEQPPSVVQPAQKFCMQCGGQLLFAGIQHCPHCGAKLLLVTTAAATPASEPSPRHSRGARSRNRQQAVMRAQTFTEGKSLPALMEQPAVTGKKKLAPLIPLGGKKKKKKKRKDKLKTAETMISATAEFGKSGKNYNRPRGDSTSSLAEQVKEMGNRRTSREILRKTRSDRLGQLSHRDLDAIWKDFDKDNSGSLEENELRSLAKVLNKRILQQFKTHVKILHPDMTSAEITKVVEKERSFLLPGKKGREIPELVSRIMDTLDVDGDRHITKVEFRMQWEKLCHDLFDGINQLKADSGGAGGGCCIVM